MPELGADQAGRPAVPSQKPVRLWERCSLVAPGAVRFGYWLDGTRVASPIRRWAQLEGWQKLSRRRPIAGADRVGRVRGREYS